MISRLFAFLVLVAGAGASAHAEVLPVGLAGRVTDSDGAAVAGAVVRVAREDGGIVRRGVSDSTGQYRIELLSAGSFVMEVEKPGFRRQVRVVTISQNQGVVLDVLLQVGGIDETVVVTAAGRPQEARETSKALTTVDAREIQDRNEATLSEIIRYAPGVQVRDNGGPGQLAQLRIRGLRPDAAAVLVDGFRFRDASTTQADVTSFLSNLNFVAADRVEVLRGSGSSLYGTNAVGGVVNIVSREGGGPLRGEAQVEGGSLGNTRARGSLSGSAFKDRLAFSGGGLQWNVRDGRDGDDSARSTGGQGMIRWQISPKSSLTGRIFGSSDRVKLNVSPTASGIPAANIPNAVIVDAIPIAPAEIERTNRGQTFSIGNATYFPGRNDPDSRRSSWFQTTALRLQQVASSRLSWQTSYQRVRTSRTFLNGPLGAGFQPGVENFGNSVGDIDTVDARVVVLPTSWLNLTAGYEFEREAYYNRQDNNQPAPQRIATQTRIAENAHAGFASAQLGLFDRRLQVSVSGRLQTFQISLPRLAAVGTMNPYDRVAISAPPHALTGDVSAAYFLAASNTKLRAHGGNAYRAPALYERFGGGFSTDPGSGMVIFTAYGDPRLEPDRYRAVDAGVDQYLWHDRILASATFFYIDINTLTLFDSSGGIRPGTDPFGRSLGYLNGAGGFSRGAEVGLEARPTATLRVSASYTHTRAETAQDITVPGFFIVPGVFEHTVTLVVTNRWKGRFEATFDLFHGSEAFGSFSAAGRPRAYRYPAFTKAGFIGGYRISGGDDRPVRAYVKIDNLFDHTYYQSGWNGLGRTALVGLSVGF